MYTPRFNAEEDLDTLRAFVHANPLAALVTHSPAGMVATHIPMVLHETPEGFGTLRGHLARANSQWRDLTADTEALCIFNGPQHYISASWYPGKQAHGKEVPTWNYVAVHAYAPVQVIEDPAWLLDHLHALTDQNETITPASGHLPWSVSDAPPDFIQKLTGGIIGLELPVSRIEGKWKVSQNRSEADAAGVVHALETLNTPEGALMRDLVQTRRPR